MSAASNPIDVGSAFRGAMFDAAKAIFASEPHVYVSHTNLGRDAKDVVLIGVLDGAHDMGEDPMSMSQRSQYWDLSLDVHTYAFRAGGADIEQQCDAQAYEAAASLMSRIAENVRRSSPEGDTTLGGTVMWCRLESFTTTPGQVQAQQGIGRMWEFVGTFVARVRVTG